MATGDTFFEGFLSDYFAEAAEHLTSAADALLQLDKSIGNPSAQRAAVDDLFRYFHTLKAISAMVELRPAEQLAHHLEHYLRAIRDGQITLTSAGSDVLIDGTKRLEEIVNAHRLERDHPPIADLVARVEALVGHAADQHPAVEPGAAGDRVWLCTFVPTRALLDAGVGVDAIRKRLASVGRIVEASPHVLSDGTVRFEFTVATAGEIDLAALLQNAHVSVVERPGAAPSRPEDVIRARPADGSAQSHVVRVDLSRLDQLMQNVGDLVITRARLIDSVASIERYVPAVEWRSVHDNAVALDRQLRTLREGIMRIRLVPVGEIFRRMPFVVRDLARETGKEVLLHLEGQATEIDKYLIERMMDPVVHLVRNAISHGIESPDIRIARGKRPEGTITLTASTVGDLVTLEIADDGEGVDLAAVAAKARASGLPVPAAGDSAGLLEVLCAPGFSTRKETDRASGRGVGMAVVKDTVEALSGTLAIETAAHEGTRFIIQLPVTLAITDALIGRVGTESFAVPQGSVREVIDITADDIRSMEGNELVPYRDGALPIVRLSKLFAIETRARDHFHVFVVGSGSGSLGLVVDRIIGQREIVVRAIADPLARVDGISGATDLGDGRVVLILDPAALARVIKVRGARVIGNVAEWGRLQA
jgi:two-component system chemotaxis sensor kinase CheA